jgi:hypothetical protein
LSQFQAECKRVSAGLKALLEDSGQGAAGGKTTAQSGAARGLPMQ